MNIAQTYNPQSTDAQSGTAFAEIISELVKFSQSVNRYNISENEGEFCDNSIIFSNGDIADRRSAFKKNVFCYALYKSRAEQNLYRVLYHNRNCGREQIEML